jgi:hypothetical protein
LSHHNTASGNVYLQSTVYKHANVRKHASCNCCSCRLLRQNLLVPTTIRKTTNEIGARVLRYHLTRWHVTCEVSHIANTIAYQYFRAVTEGSECEELDGLRLATKRTASKAWPPELLGYTGWHQDRIVLHVLDVAEKLGPPSFRGILFVGTRTEPYFAFCISLFEGLSPEAFGPDGRTAPGLERTVSISRFKGLAPPAFGPPKVVEFNFWPSPCSFGEWSQKHPRGASHTLHSVPTCAWRAYIPVPFLIRNKSADEYDEFGHTLCVDDGRGVKTYTSQGPDHLCRVAGGMFSSKRRVPGRRPRWAAPRSVPCRQNHPLGAFALNQTRPSSDNLWSHPLISSCVCQRSID